MTPWTRTVSAILLGTFTALPVLAAERTFERQFTLPPGGGFMLQTALGSVALVGSEGRTIVVHALIEGPESFVSDLDIATAQSAAGVSVTGQLRHSWRDGWFDFGQRRVTYTIQVPRDCPVDLRTSGGDLEIRQLSAPLHGLTSGGDVTIRNIRGAVSVHTSGGRIDAADIEGSASLHTSGGSIAVSDATGSLDVSTSGDHIRLAHIDGPVRADTSGGSVEADLLVNRGVSLVTSGGSIRLHLPASVNGSLDAHTSGGHVETSLPLSRVEVDSREQVRGTLNAGGEPIVLRTSGGSIHIDPLN